MEQTITSYEDVVEQIQNTMGDAVDAARSQCDDETPLVLAVHPHVDTLFKEMAGLEQDATLRGIAGERNLMVTDSVDGFRVVICDGEL